MAIGFTPITALAVSILGVCALQVSAPALVGCGLLAGALLAAAFRDYHRLVLQALCAGLVAVLAYDAARWLTIAVGWWGDFIPAIGGWLLGTNQPDWLVGYLYRWLGDGAGMGLAFVMGSGLLEPPHACSVALGRGIAFGIVIWLCLICTVLAAPDGQRLLFALTPVTLALSLAGHLIYGATLAAVDYRFGARPVASEGEKSPRLVITEARPT